jgi:MFS family permease
MSDLIPDGTPIAPGLGAAITAPAADEPPIDGAPAFSLSTGSRRRLYGSLLLGSLFLFSTYAATIIILLPTQVATIDPVNKVANLALVTGVGSFVTLFAQPIVGAFSDRTRSRFGRRTPWMLFGATTGGICLILLQFAPNLFWLTVLWVLTQVLLNTFQGPFSAVLADRVKPNFRGTGSAFIGAGTSIGVAAGVVLAGQLVTQVGMGYFIFGLAVIVAAFLFVFVNRDSDSRSLTVAPFRWGAFMKAFWVSPRKHPDFGWAFAARFAMILGYQAVGAYQLYILTDYISLTPAEAGSTAGLMMIVQTVFMVLSTLVFGQLSDKLGRRKVFIFIASGVMAIALLVPVVSPTVSGMLIYSVVSGLGYGTYLAVDSALMIDVLPSRGSIGKDLGVLNIATNIPQSLSPFIAAILLGMFSGNYAAIFIWAVIVTLIAAFMILPIKSVR